MYKLEFNVRSVPENVLFSVHIIMFCTLLPGIYLKRSISIIKQDWKGVLFSVH
jgi:hypothetical protein